MKATINNLKCPAGKFFVKCELEKLGIPYVFIELGMIEFPGNLSDDELEMLATAMAFYGIEIENNKISKTKSAISEFIEYPELESKIQFADFISN